MSLKVGGVGCGSIGRRHLRNLKSLGVRHLMGVEPNPGRRAETARELGLPVVDCFQAALDGDTDTVFIAAPNAFHKDLLAQAVEAGCHLFMEKPLAVTSDGLEPILAAMEARGLHGYMGSNFKFHPCLLRLQADLQSGAIGRVLAARIACGQYLPDWHPCEDYRDLYSARRSLGGGVLLDSHELDYATWLLGPARKVTCFAGRVSDLEIETEDLASLILEMGCGAIVQVQLDYLQRSYLRSYEFTGSLGTLTWDFNLGQVRRYDSVSRTWDVWDQPGGYDINQMYLDQTAHFLDCLAGKDRPRTSLRDGLRVLRLIEAAKRSSATGRAEQVL
jgi:predicted dehydrogenase